MRDRVAYVVSACVSVVSSGVDVLNHGLSVRTVVWFDGGRSGGGLGGENCRRECQRIEVGSLG